MSNTSVYHKVTNIFYMKTTEKRKFRGFNKGLLQIPVGQSREVREKLMIALGIRSRMPFYCYAKGLQEMKESQSLAVKEVFESYGITDYRDDEPCNN